MVGGVYLVGVVFLRVEGVRGEGGGCFDFIVVFFIVLVFSEWR